MCGAVLIFAVLSCTATLAFLIVIWPGQSAVQPSVSRQSVLSTMLQLNSAENERIAEWPLVLPPRLNVDDHGPGDQEDGPVSRVSLRPESVGRQARHRPSSQKSGEPS